jgi:hypothetical protein
MSERKSAFDSVLDKAEDGMAFLEKAFQGVPDPDGDTEIVDAEGVESENSTAIERISTTKKIVRMQVALFLSEHKEDIVKTCVVVGSSVQEAMDEMREIIKRIKP